MKFIFPQNYNFNAKILGIIEYANAIIDLIWGIMVWFILKIIFIDLNIRIFLFIILVLPIIIISIVGINGENILYISLYVIKFILKQKIILHEKNYY